MSDKKDKYIKEIAEIYESMIQKGMVKREFVLDVLAGKVDWDQMLKEKFAKQKKELPVEIREEKLYSIKKMKGKGFQDEDIKYVLTLDDGTYEELLAEVEYGDSNG
jgi:hypothetical protein